MIIVNNFLSCIHLVAIKHWFPKSLAQERFKPDIEFRYQIIVSAVHFRERFSEVYDTDGRV